MLKPIQRAFGKLGIYKHLQDKFPELDTKPADVQQVHNQ